MADLVCARCGSTPGDGRYCAVCGESMDSPGALVSRSSSEKPASVRPTCLHTGCDRPVQRGSSSQYCVAHTELRRRGNERNFVLVTPRGARIVVMHDTSVTLGRDPAACAQADIFADRMISARHCTVSSRDGVFWVRDEGSRNGTWVSGERLPEGVDTVVEVRLFNLALRMDIAVENAGEQ